MEDLFNRIMLDLTGVISLPELLLSILVSCMIALFIIYVYRKTYTGVVYSNSFALSILMLAMVTSIITRTISSNITLSLGMVGALSIVRFRTAVKEPLDTTFMFWAIGAGIMTGAGMYLPSILGSLGIGLLFVACYLYGFRLSKRYLLIIKYSNEAYEALTKEIDALPQKKLRSLTAYGDDYEMTYEIEVKDVNKQAEMNIRIKNIPGVHSCSFVAYQNDFGD